MLKEIQELKEFKSKSAKFYDNKISEIKNLSSKLNTYKPIDSLNKINSKLNLSENTTNLIKKIIQKA
jgi:transcription initiation factor TFIIIB Brf1 subunit/transcription initiation factor TFIIB